MVAPRGVRYNQRSTTNSITPLRHLTHFKRPMIRQGILALILTASLSAAPDLSKVLSQPDLDTVIASTADADLKKALQDNAAAILSAIEQRPHIEAVLRAVEASPGKVETINTAPEALKKAVNGTSLSLTR